MSKIVTPPDECPACHLSLEDIEADKDTYDLGFLGLPLPYGIVLFICPRCLSATANKEAYATQREAIRRANSPLIHPARLTASQLIRPN